MDVGRMANERAKFVGGLSLFIDRIYWRSYVFVYDRSLMVITRNIMHPDIEYFDPLTGESLGGDSFSWTAAILLLLDQE